MNRHESWGAVKVNAQLESAAEQLGVPLQTLLTDKNYRFMLRVMSEGCDQCANTCGCARLLLDGRMEGEMPDICPNKNRLEHLRKLAAGG